jgi:hypothetical protein
MEQLPVELAQIAENVSIEKRTEVQNVLNHVFNGVSKMREQLDNISVKDQNDEVSMKLAGTVRLAVKRERLDAEKKFDAKRAEVQQEMLGFKTLDSLYLKAKQTMQILTKEIEDNAKWKEETKERFDAEQKELKIQERILKVSKFSDLNRIEFENMTDETFEMFLAGIENQYNQKIEAEKKAEEERIAKEKADEDAREQQRLENERLKAEAEKREKEIQAERAKLKAEADKLEAELQAKKDAELKAENERKQAELKAKIEAEKLAKAPVKKQLQNWVNSFEIPSLAIENEKKTSIEQKFEAFKNWALKEVDSI